MKITQEIRDFLSHIGRNGGRAGSISDKIKAGMSKSPAKAKSSRANGRLGGRPRKTVGLQDVKK